jgi:hypothetical protein
MKNKRGDVTDPIIWMLVAVFLAISFIVVLYVNSQISDIISNTALNESDAYSSIDSAFDNINTTVAQRGYVLFVSLLIIGILVSSFLVRIHPAFLFLYILILGFTLFVGIYMGNLYETVIGVEEFAVVAADQPMITFFMQNIVKITLAVGALSMIIVFSKIFGGGGGLNESDI